VLYAITTIRNLVYLTLLLSSPLVSLPVIAQNNFDLAVLNPGEIMVNLSVREQTQVEQDTLNAFLYFAIQGRDRVAIQDEVNRIMTTALELLADSEIDYSTQQYRVFQVAPSRPTRGDDENLLWRAQQGVRLSSQDSGAVLNLVAELQEMGLTMNGLNYSLSDLRQEEVADTLMESALDRLRERSQAAAAALGKSDFELLEITMDGGNNSGFMRSTSMSLSAEAMDVATPVAEPGQSTVAFNVSARVILVP